MLFKITVPCAITIHKHYNITVWMLNINYGICLATLLSVRYCKFIQFFFCFNSMGHFVVFYIRLKTVALLVDLVWWAFHPFKLLEVFPDERYNLLKCLRVAQPFPLHQFIKERLQNRICVSEVMKQPTKELFTFSHFLHGRVFVCGIPESRKDFLTKQQPLENFHS